MSSSQAQQARARSRRAHGYVGRSVNNHTSIPMQKHESMGKEIANQVSKQVLKKMSINCVYRNA